MDRLPRHGEAAWQPMESAPKDGSLVLLFCPGLKGHVAREIVVGAWRFDANRRTVGFWVGDVGHLDQGMAESGPWSEYPALHPERWARLTRPEQGTAACGLPPAGEQPECSERPDGRAH